MNISFQENTNDVVFVVSDVPPEYDSVLRDTLYYSKEQDCFVKRFAKDIEGIDRVKLYYAQNAEEMFQQVGGFREVPWESALSDFASRAQGQGFDWWLTGSCAMGVRGISVEPHDVDIMLESADIETVREVFGENIIEPIIFSKGWVVKYFGVLFLHARIDLAFDPEEFVDHPEPVDFGPYAMRNLEAVKWHGHIVKIPPLELQLRVNRRRGRTDRVKAIEEFISRH
jgi:hypothetical protein